jgi:hypothetical protein
MNKVIIILVVVIMAAISGCGPQPATTVATPTVNIGDTPAMPVTLTPVATPTVTTPAAIEVVPTAPASTPQ